ncbi:MAG: hypothetical protein V7642_60, partial [Burkholderiales bacterium]
MSIVETADVTVREANPHDADQLAALLAEMDDEPERRMDAEHMRKIMA